MSFMWYYTVLLHETPACLLRVTKMSELSVGLGGTRGVWLLLVSPAFRTLTLVNRECASFLHVSGLLLRR